MRQFAAKEGVFEIDDDPGGVYGVASGSFFVSVQSQDGTVRLAHIIRPGTWFGHGPALTSENRLLAFAAAEPSAAVYLPLAAIRKLQADDPAYSRAFASLAEHNIRQPIQALCDLLIPRASQRIAAVLLRVTAALDPMVPHPPDGFVLTQSDLAQMANTSRQVANTMLRKFETNGWISTTYNRIPNSQRRLPSEVRQKWRRVTNFEADKVASGELDRKLDGSWTAAVHPVQMFPALRARVA